MIDVSPYILACEGVGRSIDLRVLSVVKQGCKINISPYGTKYNVAPYLKGAGLFRPDSSQVLLVRDRDFDQTPDESPSFTLRPVRDPAPSAGGAVIGHEVLLHRHEIENYLLDQQVILRFFEKHQPRRAAERPTVATVREALVGAARDLAAYQAARWALGTAAPRRLSVRTTWLEDRKALPSELSDEATEAALCAAVRSFQREAAQHREEVLLPSYRAYLARFREDVFYQEQRFLVWYVGNNLLRRLFDRLFTEQETSNGWLSKYQSEGPQFLEDPQTGTLWAPDLQELRHLLQGWSTRGEDLASYSR